MDLRSIINTEAGDSSAPRQATPITPVKAGPPLHSFRDSHQPAAASSGKHPSQDYGPRGPEPHTSPTAYQAVSHGRPSAPPPLQPPSHHDIRSPAGSQYSTQSPYSRHTPSSSISGGQYPFPSNQTPQSPAQQSPYPNSRPQRESYPPGHAPLQQQQQQQSVPPQNSYGQASPILKTPPVGTQGSTHPYYQHQRSQSSQSTSTPTSAHSQHQFYGQYPQDSPVSTSSFPHAQLPQHYRQQSQPGTPLGPPISNQRQNSGNYPQPTSPYQHRPPSSGIIHQPYSNIQVSPAQPLRPQIPRQSSIASMPGSHNSSVSEPARSSHSARERSVSISPKTQLPNLPRAEIHSSHSQQVQNGHTQIPKRKMDDREVSEPTRTPQMINGAQPPRAELTQSPQQPARKRVRYTEPPIWARSFIGRVKNNSSLAASNREVNGKQAERFQPSQPANGYPENNVRTAAPPIETDSSDHTEENPLGAWEPSILGIRPFEEVSKLVADFIYVNVVDRSDAGELASRGIEIEIEAKLGQLIDKQTNERIFLPVKTECILDNPGRVSFKSSMTEAQHMALNEFLNQKVRETHPENPDRRKPRVPIVYTHRRERDRFYELPRSAHGTLPGCMQALQRHPHTVKVRVTHDQKTGQLLAKIIKARVADLDLYNPRSPLDCRISVNLEMTYDGDVGALIPATESSRIPDRNKDRLSYTQSHYQIDLTQVTMADPHSKTEKEHELEIELSASAVREQGRRAMLDQKHGYSELIEGFMDNVRVLTRAVPR